MEEHKPLSYEVEGVKTTIQTFGFDGDKIVPDHVIPVHYDIQEYPNLTNCFVASVNDSHLIRSGMIDTPQKARQLASLAEKYNKKEILQLSSVQLNTQVHESGDVLQQHLCLSNVETKCAHLNTPLENLYVRGPIQEVVKWELDTFGRMSKLLNTEAWVFYSSWLNDDMEEAESKFLYDAVDTYTLQRFLKDFRHEVHSTLLRRIKEKISEIDFNIAMELAEGKTRKVIEEEREVIQLSMELQQLTRNHLKVLNKVVSKIREIEAVHPELTPIREKGEIFTLLLTNQVDTPESKPLPWGVQQIYLQHLNDSLGVVSAINCEHGLDRTNIAFAIRLATIQMKQLYPKADIIQMSSKLFTKFQRCVLANLKLFCVPITELSTQLEGPEWHEGLVENLEPLNYLPHDETLINYEEGKPTSLTRLGHDFMMSLSFTKA